MKKPQNSKFEVRSLQMHPVVTPTIGHRYHTSWSNNPYMTWKLICIYPDGRCLLGSKESRFETQLTALRVSKLVPNQPKPARQLDIQFMHKFVLS